jgi:flagellin
MPSINTNVAAIKARSSLDKVQRELDTSIARLSSGKRITRAHDDASGTAIAGRMESQIRGLTSQIRNAKDGQSLVDTAEGAMAEVAGILQRMRELAVAATSGIAHSTDRTYLQTEITHLLKEIVAVSDNTVFNDKRVLTGATFSFYTDIDVNGTAVTTVAASMQSLGISSTTVSVGAGTTGVVSIRGMITKIDSAIGSIASFRANFGAASSRFNHIIDNLTNVVANTEASKSRILDADFSVETTQLTRNTVLQSAATSMVAQANTSKNSILALIQ